MDIDDKSNPQQTITVNLQSLSTTEIRTASPFDMEPPTTSTLTNDEDTKDSETIPLETIELQVDDKKEEESKGSNDSPAEDNEEGAGSSPAADDKDKEDGGGDDSSSDSSAAVDEIAVNIHSSSLEKYYKDDPNATFYEKYIEKNLNKGNISNLITFFVMLLGIILAATVGSARDVIRRNQVPTGGQYFIQYFLALGLFGFAGGITNWLAVKMLFDRIPLLIGSGVIPRRFKEIRETVKVAIMKTFFDEEFLRKYLEQKAGHLLSHFKLEDKIKQALESDVVDTLIETKLNELASRPEGMWLAMMGIQPGALKPMIKPFVVGMGGDMAPLLMEMFNPAKIMNIDKIRNEIDRLMTTKLNELSPPIVKKLMEEVMRRHLGWLIVWGNVFGGVIGLISTAVGY